jgi:hypothetical protein
VKTATHTRPTQTKKKKTKERRSPFTRLLKMRKPKIEQEEKKKERNQFPVETKGEIETFKRGENMVHEQ